jgi:hypothetical protein
LREPVLLERVDRGRHDQQRHQRDQALGSEPHGSLHQFHLRAVTPGAAQRAIALGPSPLPAVAPSGG